MKKFLIEVYVGDGWRPFKLQDSDVGFRIILKELEVFCHKHNLSIDAYRVRHLTDSSDIIEAGRSIGRQDKPNDI